MKTQYTPAPWIIHQGEDYIEVYQPKPDTEADKSIYMALLNNQEDVANANLIAAAPELLKALENCLKELWDDRHSHCNETQFENYFKDEIDILIKAGGNTLNFLHKPEDTNLPKPVRAR